MNRTFLLLRPRRLSARLRRSLVDQSPSTARWPVIAPSTLLSLTGLPIVPSERVFWSTARRKFCWRSIRSKSPSSRPWRIRTYFSASSPWTWCQPFGPLLVLLAVVDRLRDEDVDAADRLGEVVEAGVVDDGHVVDVHAAEVLDRAPGAERAVLREGLVDLVPAVLLALGVVDRHVGVARHRDDVRRLPVGRDVDDHHRVAAVGAGVPLAVLEQLGDGRLLDQSLRVVGAHQQDVDGLVRRLGRPLVLVGPAATRCRCGGWRRSCR